MADKKSRKRRIINQRHMIIAEILDRKPAATQFEILEILEVEYSIKVAQSTVSGDLKAIRKMHFQRSQRAMDMVRSRLLEEYQTIYVEAMNAWYKSLENKEVVVTESVSKPETRQDVSEAMERLKAMERTEGQSGNPALLAQARGALQDIEDLLGLEQPKKQEVTGAGGGPVQMTGLVILPAKEPVEETENGEDEPET